MNILYIAHENSLGGATRSLLGLIDEMLIKNHNITVLVPGKQSELIDALEERNVRVIYGRYYLWMGGSRNFNNKLKSILKLILNYIFIIKNMKKLRNSEIEIIHTNSLVINIGALIKKHLDTKVHVWHIREFGEEDHGLFFNFNRFRSLKSIEKYSDGVVVISKALRTKFINYISEDKLHLIYNGIPTKYIQNKNFHRKNEIHLLISGSLNEGKGQKEAILAVNELVKDGIEGIVLNIAGRGSYEYFNELESMVEKYMLQDNVKFLGQINDMNQLRAKMDIELVCSRSEAFGRVTIEAMMSMNPVIASDTGANPELINHGENGLLYSQGNYNDLAEKLKLLIDNQELIRIYGYNGQKHAIENYSATHNANKIEELYLNLLENRGCHKKNG